MGGEFGARLKEHRRRAGLTQQALARVAQLSVSAVARLEQGGRPALATVTALAGALGVPVRALAPTTPTQTHPPRTN
jgi:transcriptional regulator with XRE-family HTH domain